MLRARSALVSFCILLTSPAGLAADFDGSAPLNCVALDAVECDATRQCLQGPAWEVNLPVFLEVDFEKKRVRSIDRLYGERESEVLATKALDGLITLMGAEGGYAWSLAISTDTGMMSLALSGKDHGLVVTGACNPGD